ncbi:hypothetical protein HGB07_04105 [Candidatus Roizmanbacteria bacterium]|nr:hypothetical protein [Candidatus Roizmanbacteria bacterium]
MNEIINEKVSVITLYDRIKGSVMPVKIKWQGRTYAITKLGYHHKVTEGRTLIHIFSVSNEETAFKLRLDTNTLHWTLLEIYDELGS